MNLNPYCNNNGIRRTAVRETSISRNHGGQIEGPLKPHAPSYSTIVLRGSSLGPLLCQNTPVSWTGKKILWNFLQFNMLTQSIPAVRGCRVNKNQPNLIKPSGILAFCLDGLANKKSIDIFPDFNVLSPYSLQTKNLLIYFKIVMICLYSLFRQKI